MKVFGATHDAYSTHWEGPSHASPEYTAIEMQKAVRWAIASAEKAETPSLTVFVLPYYERANSAYQQYLGHSLVYQVAKIPKQAIRLQTPAAWSTGKILNDRPNWDMLCFVVANSIGLSQYLDAHRLRMGLQIMMAETGKTFDFSVPDRETCSLRTLYTRHPISARSL